MMMRETKMMKKMRRTKRRMRMRTVRRLMMRMVLKWVAICRSVFLNHHAPASYAQSATVAAQVHFVTMYLAIMRPIANLLFISA